MNMAKKKSNEKCNEFSLSLSMEPVITENKNLNFELQGMETKNNFSPHLKSFQREYTELQLQSLTVPKSLKACLECFCLKFL